MHSPENKRDAARRRRARPCRAVDARPRSRPPPRTFNWTTTKKMRKGPRCSRTCDSSVMRKSELSAVGAERGCADARRRKPGPSMVPAETVDGPRTTRAPLSHSPSLQSLVRSPMPAHSSGRPISRKPLASVHRLRAYRSLRTLPHLRGACPSAPACPSWAVPHWKDNALRPLRAAKKTLKIMP